MVITFKMYFIGIININFILIIFIMMMADNRW